MDIIELEIESSFLYSILKNKQTSKQKLKLQNQQTTSQLIIHHFVKLSFDEEHFG